MLLCTTKYSSTLMALVMTSAILTGCSDRQSTAPILPSAEASRASDGLRATPKNPTFTSFDVPGSTGTFALDINAWGNIVGRCLITGQTHGFLRSKAGVFTTIDFPGASFTVASAINDWGDIVGMYALPTAPTERHGFLLRNGVFTTIDPPGSPFTNVLGISALGDITGRFCLKIPCGPPGNGTYHGFVVRAGTITAFDVPDAIETNAWKENPIGLVLGAFRRADGISHLFVRYGQTVDTFDLPGALSITEDNGGINLLGDIVGQYCDLPPCVQPTSGAHGFVLREHKVTTIDFPGARTTGIFGINVLGDLAGAYFDAAGKNHGLLVTYALWPFALRDRDVASTNLQN